VDIGIQPYLVASSVEAFIAQRLIRVLCQKCKQEDKAFGPEIKERIAKEMKMLPKDVKIYHGKGCNECNFTGFWGRLAIYEILLLSERIKDLLMKRVSSGEIKQAAVAQGMRTLRQDGWQKVLAGLTTPSEVFEATPSDADHDLPLEEEAEFIAAVKAAELPTVLGPAIPDKALDRRIFGRLGANVSVSYRLVKNSRAPEEDDSGSPEMGAVSKDISAGGLAFYLKEGVASGSILELKIDVPNQKEPLRCLAKVVRHQSVEGTPFYETAVCFLDVSARDRQLLDKYVEKEKNK
jgi:hypothetical protein